MSHTPGPWGREDEVNPEMITAGRDADGCYIYTADVWEIGLEEPEIEANARLIAAAPEMLEALEEAIPVLTDAIEDSYCGMHRGRGLCDCKSDIVARISTIIARIKETPNA